jgi:hypothetical protein
MSRRGRLLHNRSVRIDEAALRSSQPLWTSTAVPSAASSLIFASSDERRPYLVFIRAGADSLHLRLLDENPDRNWDCCIDWYVDPNGERLAEYYCSGGNGQSVNKLEGFLEFRQSLAGPWPYRYVLLLDDDIYLRPGDLSRFFELCDRHGTFLSQPALRWFTHTTLNSLVRNPACLLRRVSFVEGMAPCFSSAALDQLVHTFRWTRSIWGTDWAWACLLEDRETIHVVDSVAMAHTRTGNGRPTLFYRKLQAMGIDPGDELHSIRRMFPHFQGPRTLPHGHVFRAQVPRHFAGGIMLVFERLKVIVRVRKQLLRLFRVWRARIEDYVRGVK